MDFVEYHQSVFVLPQKQRRAGQFLPVVTVLQVEVKRPSFLGDVLCQRRFADLPWANQRDRCLAVKCVRNQ